MTREQAIKALTAELEAYLESEVAGGRAKIVGLDEGGNRLYQTLPDERLRQIIEDVGRASEGFTVEFRAGVQLALDEVYIRYFGEDRP